MLTTRHIFNPCLSDIGLPLGGLFGGHGVVEPHKQSGKHRGGSEPKDAPGQRMRPSLARYPQKKTCPSRVPLSGWLPHGQGWSNYFHFIRTQAVTTKVSHEAGPTRPCCLVSSAVSQKGMDVTLVSSHAPETLASSCHDGWML